MAKKNNMKHAEATYSSFIGWAKWGTIIAAIVAAFVVLLIA